MDVRLPSLFPRVTPHLPGGIKLRFILFVVVLAVSMGGWLFFQLGKPATPDPNEMKKLELLPPKFDAAFLSRPPVENFLEFGFRPDPIEGGRANPFQP